MQQRAKMSSSCALVRLTMGKDYDEVFKQKRNKKKKMPSSCILVRLTVGKDYDEVFKKRNKKRNKKKKVSSTCEAHHGQGL